VRRRGIEGGEGGYKNVLMCCNMYADRARAGRDGAEREFGTVMFPRARARRRALGGELPTLVAQLSCPVCCALYLYSKHMAS
jgi:hypothetical protein